MQRAPGRHELHESFTYQWVFSISPTHDNESFKLHEISESSKDHELIEPANIVGVSLSLVDFFGYSVRATRNAASEMSSLANWWQRRQHAAL